MEVVDLAAGEYRGDDLLLFGGGEHEHHVARRLLQRLQKRVEGLRGEHVHLVDDKHLVASLHRRDTHLLGERAHGVDAVVRRGVELDDVERRAGVESLARVALVAGIAVGGQMLAVDGLGKDAGARGLAHSAGAAE